MLGQIVNERYRIEALIDRGGMGAVYRATDLLEGRAVALKFLHFFLDAESQAAQSRFHREFRVLARLDHPRIMQAYAYNTHKEVPYLVLEFLAGRTLSNLLTKGPLSRPFLLLVARQLCEALVYLHDRSIVHRDLKPGNLMLLPPDDAPQLKLMDFGLVRHTDFSRQLTAEGAALGTVAYMAPEQAQALPVDFRADLYALGVILYEMASGRLPFEHENPAMMLMQQLITPPPSPRQFKADLDENLEQLIMELLAKEPAQRPASTEMVAARLADLADDSTPNLRPPVHRADLIPRIPLIGRESATKTLTQCWSEVKVGQGQVVLLSGTAGTGKTRLLNEFGLSVQLGTDRILFGHCREHASLPYQPLIEVLDRLLHYLPAKSQDELPLELARLLPGTKLKTSDAPESGDQNEARLRLFSACWDILQQAAGPGPLLVSIEDTQWADPTTIELFDFLARRMHHAPILFVLTDQPEWIESRAPLATLQRELRRSQLAQSITIEALKPAQVAEFLKLALGQPNIPAWLAADFFRATSGIPLFIEETLKALAAEGRVAEWMSQAPKQWASSPSAALQLPQNVLDLAERRLQRLSDEDRMILTAAAVVGLEFTFELLAGVTNLDELPLLDAIERLLIARLILELPIRHGEDRYRFAQESFRQALLGTISQRRLRLLHRRTGETISSLVDTSQPHHWPVLAYHFAEAGNREQALKFLTLAGDEAARAFAPAEAVAHYSQALDLVDSAEIDDEALDHLYTRRGRALELLAEVQNALDNYEAMEKIAVQRANRALELRAIMAQATVRSILSVANDPAEAQSLLKRARPIAHDLGDRAAESKILWNLLLLSAMTGGDVHERINYGEQALALARRLNLRDQMALILGDIFYGYAGAGQWERGLAAATEARQIWRESNNLAMMAQNVLSMQIAHIVLGDYDRAITCFKEGARLGESANNLDAQSGSRMFIGFVYLERGRPDQAIEIMTTGIALGEQVTNLGTLIYAHADLAWSYGLLGEVERGLDAAQRARQLAEEHFPPLRSRAIAILVQLTLLKGDLIAAEALAVELEPYQELKTRWGMVPFMWAFTGLVMIELALAQEGFAEALDRADDLIKDLQSTNNHYRLADVLHLKGRCLLATGQHEEAIEILAEARAESEALGSRRSLWPILVTLSNIEAKKGNVSKAQALRQQAREIIEYIADHAGSAKLRASFLARPEISDIIN